MERSQVRKYFKEFPKWAILFILVGVIILYTQISGEAAAQGVVAGLLFMAVGILAIVLNVKGKPTDEQFDALVEKDLESVKKETLSKLGIDDSELIAEPDVIWGGLASRSDCFVGHKKGKDKKFRQTPQPFLILNYTQNQVVTYRCDLDLDKGKFLSPATEEFFYKDIVSVKTKTEEGEAIVKEPRKFIFFGGKKKKVKGNNEKFCLNNSGGDSLSIDITSFAITEELGEDIIMPSKETAEKALNNIRRMLREKKA